MKQHLWLLHGNLQQPTVWDPIIIDLQTHAKFQAKFQFKFEIHKENLWTTPSKDFWSWADYFCAKVAKCGPNSRHHLVGYSLGGRLALHAIIQHPELWNSAMIIASDTGLKNNDDKIKQLAWDKAWAERFLSEDWNSLLQEWNQLSVFQGFENPNLPLEEDFSREAVAECFESFSKGLQDDLLPQLKLLTTPKIAYITGSQDKKYCAKGVALAAECDVVNHLVIDNAAHRVPWENMSGFMAVLVEHLRDNLD